MPQFPVRVPNRAGPFGFTNLNETDPYFPERNYLVTGVTQDLNGNPLGGCTVKLFNTANDTVSQQVVSDGSGNYSFIVDKTLKWYIVSYLAGSPDVAGTTVNTLAGA
jgi:hypothetical protein